MKHKQTENIKKQRKNTQQHKQKEARSKNTQNKTKQHRHAGSVFYIHHNNSSHIATHKEHMQCLHRILSFLFVPPFLGFSQRDRDRNGVIINPRIASMIRMAVRTTLGMRMPRRH